MGKVNLRALASMVKLSHSLFALPFVAAAVVLVARDATLDARRLALVAIAVVAARTAAMTMNRIADRKFDERNPRTSKRELVTGAVSPAAAWGLLAGACAVFILLGGAPPAARRLALRRASSRSSSATASRSASPGRATSGSASRRCSRRSASPSR